MSKSYDQMTKVELVECVKKLGLENEVTEVAKRPDQPTNIEYVNVLNKHKAKNEAKKSTKPEIIEPVSKATKKDEKATMAEDLSTKVAIILTDHENSVQIEDDSELRTISVGWGNPVVGMNTSYVALHNRLQYVPKGCLIRLKEISKATITTGPDGNPTAHLDIPRFSVVEVDGWTQEQFDAHKEQQRLKKM